MQHLGYFLYLKCKVYHNLLRQQRRVLISLYSLEPVGEPLMSVMRGQGYVSRKASPAIGWYQIILLGDRGTCVLTTQWGDEKRWAGNDGPNSGRNDRTGRKSDVFRLAFCPVQSFFKSRHLIRFPVLFVRFPSSPVIRWPP